MSIHNQTWANARQPVPLTVTLESDRFKRMQSELGDAWSQLSRDDMLAWGAASGMGFVGAAIRDPNGFEVARGLANDASAEARLICRKPSGTFEALLGYLAEPEMVHRDNLILSTQIGCNARQ